MPTVKLTQTIEKPAPNVFAVAADLASYPKWNPIAVSATKKTEGPLGAGSKFDLSARGFGRMEIEISEYDPPRRLKLTGRTGMGDMTHLMVITEQGQKTAVENTVESKAKGLGLLMLPVMGMMLRRNLKRTTGALKHYVETGVGG